MKSREAKNETLDEKKMTEDIEEKKASDVAVEDVPDAEPVAEDAEDYKESPELPSEAELAERRRRIVKGVGETIFVIGGTMALLCGIMLSFFTGIYYDGIVSEVLKSGAMKHALSTLWITEIVSVVVAVAGLLIAVVKCGARDEQHRIKLNRVDCVFGELKILAALAVSSAFVGSGTLFTSWMCNSDAVRRSALKFVGGSASKLASISDIGGDYISFDPPWVLLLFAVAITLAVLAFDIFVIESLVRTGKANTFWHHTILGRVAVYLGGVVKEKEWSLAIALIVIFAAMLIAGSPVGFIIIAALVIYFVPKWFRKYSAIRTGLKEVKKGNLNYKIPVRGKGEFERLASDINDIAGAQKVAMENELKTQRLKSELISNVSHDLRTPLTSMVTYVDLLKAEGLDSERAPEYLRVIDEKTARLQELTENLFEAAKASSGDIPVDMQKIEMNSIINQALVELDANLKSNNIDMIVSLPPDETYIMADGKLLWRVIENLLTNISKYALTGSRAYMDVVDMGDTVKLEVKNISRDPLNISADELMERFKRGDKSRNTSGSGLGLAIAKDLTTLMSGSFTLNIDGDLFKAVVELKKPAVEKDPEPEVVYV